MNIENIHDLDITIEQIISDIINYIDIAGNTGIEDIEILAMGYLKDYQISDQPDYDYAFTEIMNYFKERENDN